MDSRSFGVVLLGILSLFAQAGSLFAQTSGPRSSRPNILMIAIDDLNDWVGCLGGHEDAETPHIDRLAKRGTLFLNAHCQAPICNPSRTSVMYGVRPSTSGIYSNAPKPWTVAAMNKRVTLPRWLAKQGYKTLTTGKLYHASGLPPSDFDVVGPRPGQRLSIDKQLVHDIQSGSKLWDFGAQSYPDHEFQDHADASWAIEQLQQDHGRPFFLTIGFYRPHVPWYAPERCFDNHPLESVKLPAVRQNDRDDLPKTAVEIMASVKTPPPHDWFLRQSRWQRAVQSYLACIRWTDEQVGRLLDALDQSKYRDNTIVVLFSDHGFHLGEKQHWAKFTLWERSTHVPLVIMAPGMPQGQITNAPAELLSIYPTLCELTGTPLNPQLDGNSLVPLLKDKSANWPHVAVTTHGKGNHAVRSERYRYIRYRDGSQELYDLKQDPQEWNNLATPEMTKQYRAVVQELRQHIPSNNANPARPRKPKPRLQRPKRTGEGRGPETIVKAIDDPNPPVTAEGYQNAKLCGWSILISEKLRREQPDKVSRAIELAGEQLNGLYDLLPEKVIKQLQQVPIWFSPPYPGFRPTGEYHASRGWLVNQGRPPQLVRCVELTNVGNFENECRRMPMLMLHELAHAYHHRVLGFNRPEIVAAYDAADEAGLYRQVQRNNGRIEKAYAMTNHKEYFAELTECFFGINDFYPFTREQLKKHDPRMDQLLSRLWQVDDSGEKTDQKSDR